MPSKKDTSLEDSFDKLAEELNPANILGEILPKIPTPLELLDELDGK